MRKFKRQRRKKLTIHVYDCVGTFIARSSGSSSIIELTGLIMRDCKLKLSSYLNNLL